MPELPEVETTRRGIAPELTHLTSTGAVVRNARLRHPIPEDLDTILRDRALLAVERRAKYLLLRFPTGSLLVHLGMSGSLRIVPAVTPPEKHDHLDILFGDRALRLRDPRRFGLVLWQAGDAPIRSSPDSASSPSTTASTAPGCIGPDGAARHPPSSF